MPLPVNTSAFMQHATLPALVRLQQRALIVGAIGLGVCLIGAWFSPVQFFRSYLYAYLFWLGIALGCLAVVMLQHLTGGGWGVVSRRLLESATRTLPLMALLFVPLLFGMHHLYLWTCPTAVADDPLLQQKAAYLNVPFFIGRVVLYFVAWIGVAFFLNRWSVEQDQEGDSPRLARRFRLLSGPGLVLYGAAITFASIDWVMSLDPHWFSTMFGVLFMGGQGLSAFAFVIVMVALLADRAPLVQVILPGHVHDLGKLMLAFVMLWAYFAFSQYLIIWSGNIAEETPWYLRRLQSGWQWVGLALVLFHFVLPFLLLLSRDLKRDARRLALVAGAVLAMRLVDLFWLVMPVWQPQLTIHWMDILAPIGLGGLWLAMFTWRLRERPLLPLHDPAVQEMLEHGRE